MKPLSPNAMEAYNKKDPKVNIDFEIIIQCELEELHYLMDEILLVPQEAFKKYGSAAFRIQMYEELLNLPTPIEEFDAQESLEEARKDLDKLCRAVPAASRACIEALSMAYAVLGMLSAGDLESGDHQKVFTLMTASMMKGAAIARLPGSESSGDVLRAYERKRKQHLSDAGKRGAVVRFAPFQELKDWALGHAAKMKDDDMTIARKLSTKLPPHLANVSKDPTRVIYDAIRASGKPASRNA
ncbi:MAG: hypothetical protein EON54_25955 [Alcaligenaceae bacterium]|nr:MAG: hypothetical protein EON54_25955 [Alcaligenaceae bacterium]